MFKERYHVSFHLNTPYLSEKFLKNEYEAHWR